MPQSLAPRLMETFGATRRGDRPRRRLDHLRHHRLPRAVRRCAHRPVRRGARDARRAARPRPAFVAYPFARSHRRSSTSCTPGCGIGLALCGLLVNVVLLSRWFVARRGPRRRRARLRLEPGRCRAAARHCALGERPGLRLALGLRRARRGLLCCSACCRDSWCCARARPRLGRTRTAPPLAPPAEAAAKSGATLARSAALAHAVVPRARLGLPVVLHPGRDAARSRSSSNGRPASPRCGPRPCSR